MLEIPKSNKIIDSVIEFSDHDYFILKCNFNPIKYKIGHTQRVYSLKMLLIKNFKFNVSLNKYNINFLSYNKQ